MRRVLNTNQGDRHLESGRWMPQGVASESIGITPEIDVYFTVDNDEILLDAKDYQIVNGSYLERSGSAPDHYKQTVYRRLITEKHSNSFYNILAFPRFGQKSLFELIGSHHWTNLDDSLVYEIGIDYDLVVRYWLNERNLNIPSELSNLLDEVKIFTKEKIR